MRTDPILDAAERVFEQYGARRANVDDIAREAGVSRSTLYRRHPSKEALLAAVVLRSVDAFFDELDRVAADLAPQEAVIECFVRGLAIMREIRVLGRLAQTEPEVLSAIPGRGHMLVAQADRVARTLRRAGAAAPPEELQMVAELMLRLASTYLLDPEGRLDLTDEQSVRDFAKRYLAPLVS